MATLGVGTSVVLASGGRGLVSGSAGGSPSLSPAPTCRDNDFLLVMVARTCTFPPRGPRAEQLGTQSKRSKRSKRRRGFLPPPKPPSASQIGFPPAPSPRSRGKPRRASWRRPQSTCRGADLPDPEAACRRTERAATETPAPAHAPAPDGFSAGPSCSLPAGARAGLGCALLRVLFPGISASGRRPPCRRSPGVSVPHPEHLGAAARELHARGGTGRTGAAGPNSTSDDRRARAPLRSERRPAPALSSYGDFPGTVT